MNALPDYVQERLELELAGVSMKKIFPFAEKLSLFYRHQTPNLPPIETKEEHLAYLITRLPATYAALFAVLQMLPFEPTSLLDLGSGPGTGWMAARELFPLTRATLVERDSYFIELGKKLCGSSPKWVAADLVDYQPTEEFDLIIISYALGELDKERLKKVIEQALQHSSGAIMIVEPGTPRGYETIIQARNELLQQGAHLLAPCPHENPCPLHPGDWCHFSTRLPRSKLHQYVKEASLGYEDEKFSYIIASKTVRTNEVYDRILREPARHSGHTLLTLCTNTGTFEQKTIARRDKEAYTATKRAKWGGKWGL